MQTKKDIPQLESAEFPAQIVSIPLVSNINNPIEFLQHYLRCKGRYAEYHVLPDAADDDVEAGLNIDDHESSVREKRHACCCRFFSNRSQGIVDCLRETRNTGLEYVYNMVGYHGKQN